MDRNNVNKILRLLKLSKSKKSEGKDLFMMERLQSDAHEEQKFEFEIDGGI